ncbi:MAG: hypothetical protein R2771_12430 [Saprospiraceae bacterium]
MNILYYKGFLIISLLVLFTFSCNENKEVSENQHEFIRYDKLLFSIDTSKTESQFSDIYQKYPTFTDIYFDKVMNFHNYDSLNTEFYHGLNSFVSDSLNIELFKLVNSEYGYLSDIETDFNSAYNKLKTYFPDITKPKIYTFISIFNYQGFLFDDKDTDGIGIGLDMFLGDKFPYSNLASSNNEFSNYLIRTYNKDHLLKNIGAMA